jgi:hypothetical protein
VGDLGSAKEVWFFTGWFPAKEISGPPLSIELLKVSIDASF